MIIRFKTPDGDKIVDTDYIEIEGVFNGEVKNGKWVFRDAGKKD